MRLILVILSLAVLAWSIETAPAESFETDLILLNMKIENLEKRDNDLNNKNENLGESDHDLKKKIENMEKSNNDLKKRVENIEKINNDLKKKNENMEKSHNDLKKKIENIEESNNIPKKNIEKMASNMEKKEISKNIFLENPETRKMTLSNDEGMNKTKKTSVNNLHKNENREDQNDEVNMSFVIGDAGITNILDGKISYCENEPDCCDNLTNEINDIKVNMEHFNERLNDNTRKIIENQLEIQNNKKEIDKNTNNSVSLMKRSDYCASKETWNPDQINQVINYDKLLLSNNYDIPGAQMDIENGEFTAGVSAIYQIGVFLRLVVTNSFETNVYLRRNGVNMAESRIHTFVFKGSDPAAAHDDIGGRYMMLQLDAGDTVSVFVENLDHNIKDVTFCINLLK